MMPYTDGYALDGGGFGDYSAGSAIDGGSFNWEQSALEKMRAFVSSYPHPSPISGLAIDYTDNVPNSSGLFPSGLVEISRTKDLLGNTTVINQYNFALYAVLEKSPDEDFGATENAEWQMAFQEWVQERSISGNAPAFGDDPRTERITAQNGTLFSAEDEGTAVYAIQMSVTFTRNFQR